MGDFLNRLYDESSINCHLSSGTSSRLPKDCLMIDIRPVLAVGILLVVGSTNRMLTNGASNDSKKSFDMLMVRARLRIKCQLRILATSKACEIYSFIRAPGLLAWPP